MKICTIVGARPQFIKSAVVSKNIISNKYLHEIIIHTGQHFDENMSHIFFDQMEMRKPDYNLGINSLSPGAMVGRQLEQLEKILQKVKPDFVLVYGDTNSTLAGALAGAQLDIPIAHVEAGLRSFNRSMPEEINRILTDHLSEICFVPTNNGFKNLVKEGIPSSKIYNVGDVMYDAAIYFGKIAEKKSKIIKKLFLEPKNFILATVHRQESTNDANNLKNIFSALEESPIKVIMPLHPRTKNALKRYDICPKGKIKLIDPLGYLDMLMLEKNACVIVTDSGGVQKEAFFNKVPCIILRNETEWIELIENNVSTLVGLEKDKIIDAIFNFRSTNFDFSFYGTGEAGELICKTFQQY